MIPFKPLTRRKVFTLAAIYLAVTAAFALFGGGASAGNRLYDMRALLTQPHPFARIGDTRTPVLAPVTRRSGSGRLRLAAEKGGGAASGAVRSSKDKDADVESLDLDGLPGAQDGDAEELDVNDPLEPLNRVIFGFNEVFNFFILEPVAKTYNFVLPEFARERISNFLANIRNPVVLVNDLLQGELERGMDTGARLVINTTLGLGGAAGPFDVVESLLAPTHVRSHAECLARTGEDDGADVVVLVTARVRAPQLCAESEVECIRTLRTIEGNRRDTVFDREQNVLVHAFFH